MKIWVGWYVELYILEKGLFKYVKGEGRGRMELIFMMWLKVVGF